MPDDPCSQTQLDGTAVPHDWRFDCDNPWLICKGCGEVRDALTGAVMINA